MAVTLFLVYAILALAPIALYLIKRRMGYWKRQGIPHTEPNLLVGNFQGLFRTRNFYDMYKEEYEKFKGTGPFCGFYFPQRPAVIALDLQLVKNVLIKDFSNFVDRGLYHNEADDPLTGHLFLLDGNKWRKLRSKLSPTFTSGKMKTMFPTIVNVAHQFVDVFGEMTQSGGTVEVKELLARFTTDVIGTCAFGLECNSLKDPNAEFRVMGIRSLTERRHGGTVFGLINGFPKLARKLHMCVVPDEINNFFIKIVRDSVDFRTKNNIKRNDFLNILMDLSREKTGDASGLTIEEMAAQAFVFFLGGFETSSTTMGWTLYEISVNQKIQDKLRSEIKEVLAKHNNEFTYECMQEMTYMGQVISETLRKYSIVPHLNREALNDYPIPGHPKYVIRKGMPVIIPVIGIHHDPDIYPNPEQYDPERFSPEQEGQREQVAFLGFGDGPRNCIGLRFGQMQTRIGLTFLLKNFKFTTCKDTEIPPIRDRTQFVTVPKNGIHLNVEKI